MRNDAMFKIILKMFSETTADELINSTVLRVIRYDEGALRKFKGQPCDMIR